MNPFLSAKLCLFAIGCAASATADITLRVEPGQAPLPWASSWGGGTLAASTLPKTDGPSDCIPVEIQNWDYFAQSILGNGEHLTGFALYGTGLNSPPVTYTLFVLSHGNVNGPIDSTYRFNPPSPGRIVATASFTLGQAGNGKLYFQFSGEDGVLLQEGHGYVFIIAPESPGTARFYRLPDGDSYPHGTCAVGHLSLNPGAFNSTGARRDAIFALYTKRR